MSIVRINDSVYPFALKRFFSDDVGYPIYLEFYQGTEPTKAAFEAADIYRDSNDGWIDPSKLAAYITGSGNAVVRRWKLNDFSKDIQPISLQEIQFNFSDRPSTDYLVSNDAENIYNVGQADWFMIRSTNDSDAVHYFFTGSISDVNGSGDMRMLRTALTQSDFIIPNNVLIDLGNLVPA